ncbi:EAL domain-containing protein [Shewanella psychropiezotolerans]|uniref:EAL domain-containing protein n=1 Tax=Shewanella psychropiezotolerans TaxID=2593655 RepID=A0ABX5WVR1_9GAMM|nr:EAL domain-containing protein [Shewanella psychropiezotolerans]QDO83186.1 EAL domain-containing protein [Shewanella psychropiezotolerans]
MPNTDDEMDMLVEFIHSELVLNGLKVIVEAVETKTQLKSLNKALIYGYQGRLLKSKKS